MIFQAEQAELINSTPTLTLDMSMTSGRAKFMEPQLICSVRKSTSIDVYNIILERIEQNLSIIKNV